MSNISNNENFKSKKFSLINFREPLLVILIFVLYFITAKFGLMVDAVSGFATLAWAPSGIALAAILLLGYRIWPAIAWAAFIVNYQNNAPFPTAVGIALGNTLEAVTIGYILFNFTNFQKNLIRQKDIICLLGAMSIGAVVSATIGSISVFATSVNKWEGFFSTWVTWWMGDIIGGILFTPLILVATSQSWPIQHRWNKIIETVALTVGVIFLSCLVFRNSPEKVIPFSYACSLFPIIVWSSVRFGQIGSTKVVAVIYFIGLWGTTERLGPFSRNEFRVDLFSFHTYIAVVSLTALFLSSSILSRRKSIEL